ncbi:sigma-E processing peptidase SpoIIGA [Mammaliicoccus sciuri]|uniref:Sporulation specific protein SpoIIGA n=1 Tax=Sporosarcina newyorkensis 2681 TaxID=1027292 RepID=F9DPJ0_9BACL|nr:MULTISPECIES: sigma-E processing peptidase SpoIIGA [Sporosarcina]EGQ27272.1 sporulation specific protein SpoIIGA [Sporosarcina newyorkensis 2681]MBY0222139.1 sigma-E processing peptidase SpoIIGA [Sporosarcina aquimarina]
MYGELMIGINMLFNYAILSFTNKVGNHQTSRRRLWSASFIGAFFITLFPYSVLAIIVTFLGMTYIAFGQTLSSWKSSVLAVLIAAFFAGGLLTLVYANVPTMQNNSLLLIAIGLTYLSLYIVKIKWLDTRKNTSLIRYTLDSVVQLWGQSIPLKVFIDTGNHCIEPISGAPVHFIGYQAVKEQLPADFSNALEKWKPDNSPDLSGFPSVYQKDLRLIRLQTVQGASWTVGIKFKSWLVDEQPLPSGYIVLTKEQRQYPQGASAILQVSAMEVMKEERRTDTC